MCYTLQTFPRQRSAGQGLFKASLLMFKAVITFSNRSNHFSQFRPIDTWSVMSKNGNGGNLDIVHSRVQFHSIEQLVKIRMSKSAIITHMKCSFIQRCSGLVNTNTATGTKSSLYSIKFYRDIQTRLSLLVYY